MAGKGAPLRYLQSVRTAEAEQFLMKSRWGAERSGEIKKKCEVHKEKQLL